jgi:hypothetical protein
MSSPSQFCVPTKRFESCITALKAAGFEVIVGQRAIADAFARKWQRVMQPNAEREP